MVDLYEDHKSVWNMHECLVRYLQNPNSDRPEKYPADPEAALDALLDVMEANEEDIDRLYADWEKQYPPIGYAD